MRLILKGQEIGSVLLGLLDFSLQSPHAEVGNRSTIFFGKLFDLLLQFIGDLKGNHLVTFHKKDYTVMASYDKLLKGHRMLEANKEGKYE